MRRGYVPALGLNSLTRFYDPVVALTTRERLFKRRLLEQAAIPEGAEVLDLGCGTGTLAVKIARSVPGSRVTGLDGDARVLRRAERKAAAAGVRIRFDRGRVPPLPYDASSFDQVVSSLFFHHLGPSDKLDVAREVQRVLRPGGRFHVADWGRPNGSLMRLAFYSVQMLDGFEPTADNVEGRLPEIFRAAGFRDVRTAGEIPTVLGTLALYGAVAP